MDVGFGQNIFICTLNIFFPVSHPVVTAIFPKVIIMLFCYTGFIVSLYLKNSIKALVLLQGDRLLLTNKSREFLTLI